MTYLLVYVSSATWLLSVSELVDLLDTSRKNNIERGLTGALLYQDGNFMQVLEGDQEMVEAAYSKIVGDERHHDVTLLWEERSAVRQFDRWSMAFRNLSDRNSDLAARFDDFFQAGGSQDQDVVPAAARYLLDSFRQTLNTRGI